MSECSVGSGGDSVLRFTFPNAFRIGTVFWFSLYAGGHSMWNHMLFFVPFAFFCSSFLVSVDTCLKEELFGKSEPLEFCFGIPTSYRHMKLLNMGTVCLLTGEQIQSRSLLLAWGVLLIPIDIINRNPWREVLWRVGGSGRGGSFCSGTSAALVTSLCPSNCISTLSLDVSVRHLWLVATFYLLFGAWSFSLSCAPFGCRGHGAVGAVLCRGLWSAMWR